MIRNEMLRSKGLVVVTRESMVWFGLVGERCGRVCWAGVDADAEDGSCGNLVDRVMRLESEDADHADDTGKTETEESGGGGGAVLVGGGGRLGVSVRARLRAGVRVRAGAGG